MFDARLVKIQRSNYFERFYSLLKEAFATRSRGSVGATKFVIFETQSRFSLYLLFLFRLASISQKDLFNWG